MIDKSEMNELRERVEDLLDNQIRDWGVGSHEYLCFGSLKTRYLYIRDFPVILQFNPSVSVPLLLKQTLLLCRHDRVFLSPAGRTIWY